MMNRILLAGIGTIAVSLSGGLAAYSCLASTETTVSSANDEKDWRESHHQDLRDNWDTMEGKPAPALKELSGWLNTEARSWKDLEGKVVLLDYWATWCGPCRKGIPHLVEMHEKYEDDGLVILGVHSSRGFEKMESFVAQEELPYAFAADTTRNLGSDLGIKFIPSYFVIDRSGTMRVAGANRNKLDTIIETLLEEPYVPANASYPEFVEKELYADDHRGEKAPELAVETWLGDQPDMKDKVILVDFWATWCGPCRKAIPHMNDFAREFSDDLVVIGLSDEDPNIVKEFMKNTKMSYPQAIDTSASMKGALGVRGIPHVMIMSSDGVIRWQGFPGHPADPLTSKTIQQIINADPGVKARHARESTEG